MLRVVYAGHMDGAWSDLSKCAFDKRRTRAQNRLTGAPSIAATLMTFYLCAMPLLHHDLNLGDY
jgi:hypothetical protein